MFMKRLIAFYRKKLWSAEKYARYLGVNIGSGCHIASINFGTEPYLIKIGNKVQITNNVKFLTHSGGWVFREKHPKLDVFGKIIIKDNVYIGNDVIILPGVTIGSNVIVGAGSVVTKSVPNNSVIAGNPARIISSIEKIERKLLNNSVDSKGMSYHKKKQYLLSLPDEKFIKKP